MFADNKVLGQFDLVGIPPAPRSVPQIEVTFDIDANGIVHVSAKDLGTKKEQSIKITATTNLSDEEIEKMRKDAELHAEEDKTKKEKVDTLNQAETIVFQYEKTLKDMPKEADQSKLKDIQKDIDGLKKLLEDKEKNYELIKKAKDELTTKFQKVSEEMYKNAAAQQQAQQSQEQPKDANKKDDEKVVDADYEEVKDDKDKKDDKKEDKTDDNKDKK